MSFYSEAGQWQDATRFQMPPSRPKTVDLNDLPQQVLEINVAQWLQAGFNLPVQMPNNETKASLELNVSTSGNTRIQVSEASNGVVVTTFKASEGLAKTTSVLEQDYLKLLNILTLNNIKLVFDSQDNALSFSFQGNTFILSEFSDAELSDPHQSFLISSVSLMPEVLQLITSLIQYLNEYSLAGATTFPGGTLEPGDVNEYYVLPGTDLFPTSLNTSFCTGSSYCIPLSQFAWLVYSGQGKAAIIGDPYHSDEPMDGKKGGKKKTAYKPAPAGFTNFRVGNTSNGGIGIGNGSNSGDDGDGEKPRETDYSRTPPAAKNEFEDDETYFQSPPDDDANERDAQLRSDQERSGNALLTRDAVQGRRNGRQLLDVVGGESEGSKEASPKPSAPPEAPTAPDQGPPETGTVVTTFDADTWLPDDDEETIIDPSNKGRLPKGMSSREQDLFINIDDI
ncbi:hypothetical protein [Endozoicomonas arenosclerae]|uniref:hypothetical protein n=1 Tax=Endozoicomonas arenosclerae TaxID=1633495 RepID=UPI00129474E5|nr:hypothetical protein [Endozoicomonas arenosclerae]